MDPTVREQRWARADLTEHPDPGASWGNRSGYLDTGRRGGSEPDAITPEAFGREIPET